MQKATGSNPVSSTSEVSPARIERGFFFGGLIAGEGCFSITVDARRRVDGSIPLKFVFEIQMATRDRELLCELRDLIGAGSVHDRPARNANWQPSTSYRVHSRRACVDHVVPFMDAFLLPPTRKRVQYEQWRAALFDYERERPRRVGRGVCSVDACGKPVRGRGLCRSHYYRATGY